VKHAKDDEDHKLSLTLEEVDKKGFKLVVSTWQSTYVWSLEVTWIAFDNSFLSGANGEGIEVSGGVPHHDDDLDPLLFHFFFLKEYKLQAIAGCLKKPCWVMASTLV